MQFNTIRKNCTEVTSGSSLVSFSKFHSASKMRRLPVYCLTYRILLLLWSLVLLEEHLRSYISLAKDKKRSQFSTQVTSTDKLRLETCFIINSTWRVGSGTRYLQQNFTIPRAESSEMRCPTEMYIGFDEPGQERIAWDKLIVELFHWFNYATSFI